MTGRTGRIKWGFRARLAALIAALFIAAGTLVLVTQYAVVAGLLDQEVQEVSVGNTGTSDGTVTIESGTGTVDSDPQCVQATGGEGEISQTSECTDASVTSATVPATPAGTQGADYSGAVTGIRDTVLGRTAMWTVVIIAVFAVLSALLAWWLSGRSLSRIAEVTRLARATSERDLHGRLNLPGPRDEVKELGDTLDEMLARLDHAFTERERFLANASHELRTPIAANRAALEAPLAQGRFPDDVVPDVERALAANAHSATLISALLQLARAEVNPTQTEPLDLAETLEAALDGYLDRIDKRHLAVTTDLHALTVHASQTLLIQAVDNLLDNATRYTPEQGTIRISAAALDAEYAVLTVVNDGDHYNEQEAAELLEPFHRGHQPRTDTSGHGLGLALVRAIAHAHRGTIDVQRRTEGGLSITLRLPRPITVHDSASESTGQ
ncbi:MAG: HAMP domain-containing sensor histidine kinase [Microbacterium sp.]